MQPGEAKTSGNFSLSSAKSYAQFAKFQKCESESCFNSKRHLPYLKSCKDIRAVGLFSERSY